MQEFSALKIFSVFSTFLHTLSFMRPLDKTFFIECISILYFNLFFPFI